MRALVSRLLFWEYERATAAYDVVCLLILLFLFAFPQAWLGDPMQVHP